MNEINKIIDVSLKNFNEIRHLHGNYLNHGSQTDVPIFLKHFWIFHVMYPVLKDFMETIFSKF